jgi:hypothetical protein
MKVFFLLIFSLLSASSYSITCTPTSGSTCAIASAGNGCRIETGSTCTIVANGICKNISNLSTSNAIFVSAQDAKPDDWQSWVANFATNAKSDCGCSFNGTPVNHGDSITAYQTSSVPYGNTCVSQQRTCNAGTLSGSYAFSSCSVDPGSNCAPVDGVTVNHGSSATFYLRPCEDTGNTCSSQSRACTNGSLSGTYSNASCSVAGGVSCTLDGQTVGHGAGRYFYNTTSVPFGQSCDTGTYRLYRNCSNGVLDGSASFNRASCTTAAPANCTKDSVTVNHGNSRTFYQASLAATCTGESQTCTNGSFSPNNYQFASCTVASGCSSGTRNWNTNCSGTIGAAAHGDSNIPVVNTASGYSGFAEYNCNNGTWTLQAGANCTATGGSSCANVPSKSWTVSGRTCYADTGTGTHNQNKQLIDNESMIPNSYVGSAYFLCNNGTWAATPSATPTAATCDSAPVTTCTCTDWIGYAQANCGGMQQTALNFGPDHNYAITNAGQCVPVCVNSTNGFASSYYSGCSAW